ncbi:SHOCT domain-containing protein [Siccirubricoccus deserti]
MPRAIAASRSGVGPEGSETARRLKALRDLFDQGLITAVEYDAKRREIIGSL